MAQEMVTHKEEKKTVSRAEEKEAAMLQLIAGFAARRRARPVTDSDYVHRKIGDNVWEVVYCVTTEQLLAAWARAGGAQEIGFDTETHTVSGARVTTVIALSLPNNTCLVYDLPGALDFHPIKRTWIDFPPFLLNLFRNGSVIKWGFGSDHDLHVLQETLPMLLRANAVVDAQRLMRLPSGQYPSLTAAMKSMSWECGPTAIDYSRPRWGAGPLTWEEVEHVAVDAALALRLRAVVPVRNLDDTTLDDFKPVARCRDFLIAVATMVLVFLVSRFFSVEIKPIV